jgi:hypothetical protein
MKIENREFMGRFNNGMIDEEQELTIRYSNGNFYKGRIKDFRPEGKGILID